MGITKNQRFRLSNEGYSEEALNSMSFEQASDLIGKLKPYHKEVKQGPTEFVEKQGFKPGYSKPFEPKKSGFDTTSAYTSYVKDLLIAMIEAQNAYRIALIDETGKEQEPISVETLESTAEELIARAKNRFK